MLRFDEKRISKIHMYVLCDTVITTYRNQFFVREIGSAAFCHLIVVMKIANVDRRLCTFLQRVLCLYKLGCEMVNKRVLSITYSI